MENNPVISRLRKGNWDHAVVFVKGMQPLELRKSEKDRTYIFDGDWLNVSGNRVMNPFQGKPIDSEAAQFTPQMSTMDLYVHMEEIVSVQFFQHDFIPKSAEKSLIVQP